MLLPCRDPASASKMSEAPQQLGVPALSPRHSSRCPPAPSLPLQAVAAPPGFQGHGGTGKRPQRAEVPGAGPQVADVCLAPILCADQ